MDARSNHVKDDTMNKQLLSIFPAFLLILTGCTVHNHYYGSGTGTPQTNKLDLPSHEALAEKLKGIHAGMEVIANNLMNVDTLAYKAKRVTFQEGSTMPSITTDWTSGAAVQTPHDLSLFIAGEGFFKVDVEQDKGGGVAYTRGGDFFINRDGEVVLGSADGVRLADGITVPDDAVSLSVSTDGIITAVLPDNSESDIGQIELCAFISPQGLEQGGAGLYFETETSGPAILGTPGEGVFGTLVQGMLETSNVDLVSEMIELTKLTRWSNAIHQQLDMPMLPSPPLDYAIQNRHEDEQVTAWLQRITAAAEAAP